MARICRSFSFNLFERNMNFLPSRLTGAFVIHFDACNWNFCSCDFFKKRSVRDVKTFVNQGIAVCFRLKCLAETNFFLLSNCSILWFLSPMKIARIVVRSLHRGNRVLTLRTSVSTCLSNPNRYDINIILHHRRNADTFPVVFASEQNHRFIERASLSLSLSLSLSVIQWSPFSR